MPIGAGAVGFAGRPAASSALANASRVVRLREHAVVSDRRRPAPAAPIAMYPTWRSAGIAEQDEIAQRVAHRLLMQLAS